ncbi:unnamed protein product [Oppiella nova]|uniref:Uncharacterized protein n=1 Tax=Oppiella nova TaxID=334625 RepID=A0A7R9M7K5_9ACAR|nr:unnamed protein product [Oppiella nova]CAG2171969.1 unnamed protein product [Oppiella nova]
MEGRRVRTLFNQLGVKGDKGRTANIRKARKGREKREKIKASEGQIRWCPVDRILPPLKNYSAVLIQTKNITLWISNTIVFPEYNITLSNLGDKDHAYFRNCTYHPHYNPHCPVFMLGDIINFTPNAGATYDEIAKFGADIIIKINWNCYQGIYSFIKSQPYNKCLPEYSFQRVDNERTMPITGYKFYLDRMYYDYGEKRTLLSKRYPALIPEINNIIVPQENEPVEQVNLINDSNENEPVE